MDAVALAVYLKQSGQRPEQVQDFYPTPGTLSTAMFFTGLDPRTMKPVYVPRDPHEKAMQRALMQYTRPYNHALVLEALRKTGRDDLIGYGKNCLIPPRPWSEKKETEGPKKHFDEKKGGKGGKTVSGKGKPDGKRGAQHEERRERTPKHPTKGGGKSRPQPENNKRKMR